MPLLLFMEDLSPQVNENAPEYQPMGSCESDDSQSNASRSDDNEGVPGIIYTSDDSTDVGQSDSTYIDSDAPHYYTQNVNEAIDDQLSQQCLLASNSSTPSLPTGSNSFISHPLSPINLNRANVNKDVRLPSQNKNKLFVDHPKIHLEVNSDVGLGLTRCNSTSSSSTEPEFTPGAPFLSEYEPLSCYPDDEGYGGGLNFEAMQDDPVKTQVIHEQLNMLATVKEIKLKTYLTSKVLVGGVYIDARYKDAFYAKWNWGKIRQSCVFVSLSSMVALFCISIGLLLHMPQRCDPIQQWWQGSVSYYIYVPSFQDSDGNGIGDLTGIVNRLNYLEGLGVRTVRLSCIFESTSNNYMMSSFLPANYSVVSKALGDEEDLQLLAALLHERNMFLTLDFPLLASTQRDQQAMNSSMVSRQQPLIDLINDVPFILHKWTELGIDGFIFTDLQHFSHMDQLTNALRSWRSVLDRKNRRPHRRVITVPVELFTKLESEASPDVSYLLSHVDLIDVHLNVNQSTEMIASDIDEATRWDNHVSNPWINWNLGGIGYKRLSEKVSNSGPYSTFEETLFSPTLGPSIFQLFLPGSVTLFYADEINARDADDPDIKGVTWGSLMRWSSKPDNGGFSVGTPWFSSVYDWSIWNVASLNQSMDSLRSMIRASQTKVPLYINGMFDDVGDYHPKKTNNYKIKLSSDNLLVIDRFYPRRNKYTIVMNFGSETVKKDLSKLYYGGSVLASSHGKSGYIRFQEITLKPGEALACVMDK